MVNFKKNPTVLIGVALAFVLISAGVYGWRRYSHLRAEKVALDAKVAELESMVKNYQDQLALAQVNNVELGRALEAEKNKVGAIQDQVNEITGTVGTLEKLRRLDPELLKKYSKVYFLNENYGPSGLIDIPGGYLYDANKTQPFHLSAWPALERMLQAAGAAQVPLRVVSAFRSFDTQSSLKFGYRVVYGSGANQFSADQGYSEHQLGTAVDLTTPELGANFNKFDTVPAYQWLSDHAHEFGFVLSYPRNNDYYQFEPWHWRFVGKTLAAKLHGENKYFYDLDQREIDTYLIGIFDL